MAEVCSLRFQDGGGGGFMFTANTVVVVVVEVVIKNAGRNRRLIRVPRRGQP